MADQAIEPGMVVVTSDGQSIGRVKELLHSGRYFQVDCKLAPDYYVPVDAVAATDDDAVHLSVTKPQATNSGWEIRPRS